MITVKNYFQDIKDIKISELPKDLKDAHKLFSDATERGTQWEIYNEDKEIRDTINLYVEKLNSYLKKKASHIAKPKTKAVTPAVKPKTAKPKAAGSSTTKLDTSHARKVEAVSKEIQLIRRFVNMIGQSKSKRQVLLLLNQVQKYLFERRARRVYKYAEELEQINQVLIKAFQRKGDRILISVSNVKENHYRKIAAQEVERIAIHFIKSYISLQGKAITKEQVKRLYNRIADAVNDGKLSKRNRHWKHIERILDSLKNYYHNEILTIHTAELNGLQGIIDEDEIQGQKKKTTYRV